MKKVYSSLFICLLMIGATTACSSSKVKEAPTNSPSATAASLPNKTTIPSDVATSDLLTEVLATQAANVDELAVSKEEAIKMNPLTDKQMIGIGRDQVTNYYAIWTTKTEEEYQAKVKQVFYNYEQMLEVSKIMYTPGGENKNLKVDFKNEVVTKTGKNSFKYVAQATPTADNIKTGKVDTFSEIVTIDFQNTSDTEMVYKIITASSAEVVSNPTPTSSPKTSK